MAWWSRDKDKKKTAEAQGKKRSVPSGLFQKCDDCGATVETEKVQKNLWCCPQCGFHFNLPTDERIRLICDEGSWDERDALIQPEDPLNFRDSKRYADRIRAAQKQVGVPMLSAPGWPRWVAGRCRSASSCSSSWAARWARWSARRSRGSSSGRSSFAARR